MAKIDVEPIEYELKSQTSQQALVLNENEQSGKESFSYENAAFTEQHAVVTNDGNGTVLTTKLPEPNSTEKIVYRNADSGNDGENEDADAEFEKLPNKGNKVGLFIINIRRNMVHAIVKQKTFVAFSLKILFLIGFFIFFGFSMSIKYGTPAFPIRDNVFFGNSGFAFFLITAIAVFMILWEKIIRRSLEHLIKRISTSTSDSTAYIHFLKFTKKYIWIAHILVFIAIALYVGLTVNRGRNFISLIGIFALIALGTLGSKHPHQIRWQTVFYAFVIQFIFAAIVIRLEAGFEFFDFLGKEVTKFIDNAAAGAIFVFGESYEDHLYVFKISSIIIFLGSVIEVLYFLGVMQYVIGKIAWVMQKCLKTTAAESMNAAANIFVGMTEAPLLIMPLISKMTSSELHAILVGGFATMAGSVLATFISFGVPANHLIAASVMAAPGALGFAKLLLPETRKSKTTWDTVQQVQVQTHHNVIDALMTGAANALKICGYLIANLIGFISILRFLDVSISWIFGLVHHPEVNFQYLLGLIFYPFAIMTGIPLRDCFLASKLIGIKVSLNEFIAYRDLGDIRKLRDSLIRNNTFPLYLNGTLTLPAGTQMLWEDNTIVILTYALCGFANFGSMGISLAALGVFAPQRKRTLTQIAPRALIGANMVSLMTASIAGLLYDPRNIPMSSATSLNSTLF